MLANQLAAAIEAARPSQADDLARTLWKAHATGLVTDDEAERLAAAIEAARPARMGLHSAPGARPSIFPPRRPQLARKHPERIARRRRLAASGPLPPQLAAEFTTGELSVLRVVGDEVREHGACDRTLAELAARAGVCRSLVQAALRRAARLGLLSIEERRVPGRKNLPNVLRVVSREWLAWLQRGPKTGFKKIAPTDSHTFTGAFSAVSAKHNGNAPPSVGPLRNGLRRYEGDSDAIHKDNNDEL